MIKSYVGEFVSAVLGVVLTGFGGFMLKSGEHASAYVLGIAALALFMRSAACIAQRRGK